MYYPDLSEFSCDPRKPSDTTLKCVGWLSARNYYPKKPAERHFLDALWWLCRHPIVEHRGFHECEFCSPPQSKQVYGDWGGSRIKLGSKLIFVFGSDSTAYVCPDMIFHYVLEHDYAPPEEFVRAVESGPRPGTLEFARLVHPYTDRFSIQSFANDAAQTVAARYGYFVDNKNRVQRMPDEALGNSNSQSLEEVALELRANSFRTNETD